MVLRGTARQLIHGQDMPFDDAFEFILDPFNNYSLVYWNPRAGEDMYVVINYTLDSPGMYRGLSSNESEVLLKYTRTFRF